MKKKALETLSQIETLHEKLRSHLKYAMRIDMHAITRELNAVKKSFRNGSANEKTLKRLVNLEIKLNRSIKRRVNRKNHLPEIRYPENLPIIESKDKIIETIKRNQVVVITGETGSGKTTQIPKMCIEAGRGIDGIIGCTQPRRIATSTVSRRIAEEMGEELGKSVGYKIRFDDRSSRGNYIRIMTDGILLMETQADPYLGEYDTIIVDEAHERSANIDFILGILKKLLNKRRDLKVIITSATIDTEKFSRAFDNAPIIEVYGRMYPVEVRYLPTDEKQGDNGEISYVDATVHAVSLLKKERRRGDMLIFMPTEQDIRETCDILTSKNYKDTSVLPLFSRLSSADQQSIFKISSKQKIVVATNIAETSITIPGIQYVIDTGFARISEYNPETRTKRLPVKTISRSSADQRKGRCGRVQNGICIRLYPEEDYENRPLFTRPEILRSNLAEVILRMIALKMNDISSFPFIDPPHPKNIRDGFAILEELDAIRSEKEKKRIHTVITLTENGKMMSRMPIDPRISRMIIEAQKEGCVKEVSIIAAALSTQDPRERPLEKEAEADRAQKPFINPSSDFITLLNIWNSYHDTWNTLKTQNGMRRFCKKHFLSFRRMRDWKDVHNQIMTILKEEKFKTNKKNILQGDYLYTGIHKSILSGYLSNIAVKKEKNIYKAPKGREVMIFPGSGIFKQGADWIVAAETVETSRLFARTAANIKSEWLEEVGGNLCKSLYSGPHWDKKRGEVMATEQVTLYGLVIVSGRPVSYSRINPEEATEIFIRRALVEGELERPLPFLTHNQNLVEKITGMEDKIRKRDILVSEDALVGFYEKHIKNISDIRTLKKMIRERGGDNFLQITEEELLRYDPAEQLNLYPDEISLGNTCLPCSYRFDPGKGEDGVTIKIPAGLVSSIPLESIEWTVPGLLREKLSMLIKGLPKNYRKKLVPVARTVEIIMNEMNEREGSLLSTLGKFVYERFGIDIPATIWPLETLPGYLKTRISIVDEKGKELFSGRDIRQLPRDLSREKSHAFKKAKAQWEKSGLTTWNFGELPERIELKSNNGMADFAFPALEKGNGCVNIRLFMDRNKAETSHKEGVRTLYELHFRKDLQYLKKSLALKGNMKTWANYFGGVKRLEANLYKRVISILFDQTVRSETSFFEHAKRVNPTILSKGQELLREIEPALKAYHETRLVLHDLQMANQSRRPAVNLIEELRSDLNRLMPEDFPELYDSDRLSRVPRYLKALTIRAERGIIHLEKDRIKTAEFKVFYDYLQDFRNSILPRTSEEKRKAIEEFAWMVEEYKVSLFAQELKTPFPISKKRLEKKIKEIERIG
jgi:ATP-dependent helicase HrpA